MFKIPEEMESKYRFVTVAALRAEQLQAGAPARVDSPSHKPTVIAQQEVSEGVVSAWNPDQEAEVEEAAEGAEGVEDDEDGEEE